MQNLVEENPVLVSVLISVDLVVSLKPLTLGRRNLILLGDGGKRN